MSDTPSIRPALSALQPYQAGKSGAQVRRELGLERVVKLASNEGQFGPFPAAIAAVTDAASGLNRYPESDLELVDRLAERHGVDPGMIALGPGADALVGYLSVAYLDPGDEALMGWPSFPSYHLDAIKCGAVPVHVPLHNGSYDLDAMAQRITERTRIVFVCNPNNPTGGTIDRDELARFLDAVPSNVVAIVDEAYFEYVDLESYPHTISDHVLNRPNVIVLRTFSKIYGLAGMRVGYAIGPAAIITDLARVRPPFDVNEPALRAALASLDDPAELERRRTASAAGRRQLLDTFDRLGVPVLPAAANFVCARVGEGRKVAQRMLELGVVVRPLDQFGDPDSIRVTVGTSEENEIFATALTGVLNA
jgi:histidinol-phosphate aminotransferase